MLCTCAAVLLPVAPGVIAAAADTSSSGAVRTPRPIRISESMREALNQLAAEGDLAKLRRKLPSQRADFAARFRGTLDPAEVAAALLRRANPDPFIDGYIRWQLTSFDPAMPELDDRAMIDLIRHAPAMVSNPRADRELIGLVRLAERTPRLSASDLQRLHLFLDDLDQREIAAEALNQPAAGYRDWIESRLPSAGPHRPLWLIERCGAMLEAGWPVNGVKVSLAHALDAAMDDPTVTPVRQAMLIEQMSGLRNRSRQLLSRVLFPDDGGVDATYTSIGAGDEEIEAWLCLLADAAVADAQLR
jgi:hypothetical protein